MTNEMLLVNVIDITNMFLNGQITKDEMSDMIVIVLHNNGKV